MSTPPGPDPWSTPDPTAPPLPSEPSPPAAPPAWPAPAAPDPWGGMPSYPPPRPTGTDGFAIAALVLGIVPVFGGILGIAFGVIALSRTKRSGQSGRGMAIAGIACGAIWLVIIVSVVAVGVATRVERDSVGAVTGRGDVLSEDLRVHDCVSELPEGEVRTVGVLPCAEPHAGEVFARHSLPDGDFPGEQEVVRLSEGHCARALSGFVGVPRDEDPGYDFFYVYPVASSWRFGDRTVICILSDPSGGRLTGSAEKGGPLGGGVRG